MFADYDLCLEREFRSAGPLALRPQSASTPHRSPPLPGPHARRDGTGTGASLSSFRTNLRFCNWPTSWHCTIQLKCNKTKRSKVKFLNYFSYQRYSEGVKSGAIYTHDINNLNAILYILNMAARSAATWHLLHRDCFCFIVLRWLGIHACPNCYYFALEFMYTIEKNLRITLIVICVY